MDSLLVPSSIQRIRAFLVEMCGMKVKPWASTEETLAALHTTLVARHASRIFWDSLRALLENLAHDMKARASAAPDSLIDNEILDPESYVGLLDEIRESLARQETDKSARSFPHLSASLSAPALGLLLFLGGVASVGCETSGLRQAPGKPDATPVLDARTMAPETASSSKVDAPPGPTPDTRPDTPIDGPARIVPRDTAPPRDAVSRSADGGVVTIQDIMDSCNVPQDTQAKVLGCLSILDESWRTGMAETLAALSCDVVANELGCFATFSTYCPPFGAPEKFVSGETRVCNPIPIYVGVRFV
jgi:hypothetical protein